jgi:hypothetical protein
MINVLKSQPAPECLAIEKLKARGNYNCGDVLIRLNTDFHNKCYLCENKGFTTIHTDHFVPHQGDIDLKFDWNNLFRACGHCNNTKLQLLKLLNCTDSSIKITDLIEFKAFGMPKEHLEIKATLQNPTVETQNTVNLLNAIYSGTTKNKEMASENLRDKVTIEVATFTDYLKVFYNEEGLTDLEKEKIKAKIRMRLSPESAFTAFKIWIIKTNKTYLRDFGHFLT